MKPLIVKQDHCPECEMLFMWLKDQGITPDCYETIDVQKIVAGEHNDCVDIQAGLAMNDMRLPIVWWQERAWTAEGFMAEVVIYKAERE